MCASQRAPAKPLQMTPWGPKNVQQDENLTQKSHFPALLATPGQETLFHVNAEDGNLCCELLIKGQNGISAGVAVVSTEKDGFSQIRKSPLIRPSWNCEYSVSCRISLSRSEFWQRLILSALTVIIENGGFPDSISRAPLSFTRATCAAGTTGAPEFGKKGSKLGRSNSPTALGQPILAQKCSKQLTIAQNCPKLTYKAPNRLSGLSTRPEMARICAIILVVAQKWPKSTSNVSPCWGGPPYWPQTPKIAMNGKLAKSLQMLSTRSYQAGCSMIRLFDHYFGVTSCNWTSAL